MIEFKQIIGRGTRLYPDAGKTSFEIIDYVGATSKFNDPAFDGYPARITIETLDAEGEVVESKVDDPPVDPEGMNPLSGLVVNEPQPPFVVAPGPPPDVAELHRKYFVEGGDFSVVSETHLLPSTSSGQLELTEYGALVRERIRALGDADQVRHSWAQAGSRRRLRDALERDGVNLDELVAATGVPDIDPLDALHHVAWNLPIRTRAERARSAREGHEVELRSLAAQARAILEGLLQRYEEHGVADLETADVFQLEPLNRLGSVSELARAAGGADGLRAHLDTVQQWVYSA